MSDSTDIDGCIVTLDLATEDGTVKRLWRVEIPADEAMSLVNIVEGYIDG